MRTEDLHKIVENERENMHLEFKSSSSNIARELVAFANTDGGRILVGVDDEGKIVGVSLNKTKSMIQTAADACEPAVPIVLDEVVEEEVIVIDIPRSDQFHSCGGGFFKRSGPNTQKLSRDEIDERIQRSRASPFEKTAVPNLKYPGDFDEQKFADFLKRSGIDSRDVNNVEDSLIGLGVADRNSSGQIVFNNAGVLFFATDPSRFVINSEIICVSYVSVDRVDFEDREVLNGNLVDQIIGAVNFCQSNLQSKFIIGDVSRKRVYDIPTEAIREAITNAMMHRDYLNTSESIHLEVFPTKVVVRNPGGLMRGMRKDDLGSGKTMRRNPLLAILLDKANMAERMGTGISRMKQRMIERGLPNPDFETNGDFRVTLIRATSFTSSGKDTRNLSKRQESAFAVIANRGNITTKEYSEMFGISRSMARREIKDMVRKGLLEKKGRTRGTRYTPKR